MVLLRPAREKNFTKKGKKRKRKLNDYQYHSNIFAFLS